MQSEPCADRAGGAAIGGPSAGVPNVRASLRKSVPRAGVSPSVVLASFVVMLRVEAAGADREVARPASRTPAPVALGAEGDRGEQDEGGGEPPFREVPVPGNARLLESTGFSVFSGSAKGGERSPADLNFDQSAHPDDPPSAVVFPQCLGVWFMSTAIYPRGLKPASPALSEGMSNGKQTGGQRGRGNKATRDEATDTTVVTPTSGHGALRMRRGVCGGVGRTLARRLRRQTRWEVGESRASALAGCTHALREALRAHWVLADLAGCHYPAMGEQVAMARLLGLGGEVVLQAGLELADGSGARPAGALAWAAEGAPNGVEFAQDCCDMRAQCGWAPGDWSGGTGAGQGVASGSDSVGECGECGEYAMERYLMAKGAALLTGFRAGTEGEGPEGYESWRRRTWRKPATKPLWKVLEDAVAKREAAKAATVDDASNKADVAEARAERRRADFAGFGALFGGVDGPGSGQLGVEAGAFRCPLAPEAVDHDLEEVVAVARPPPRLRADLGGFGVLFGGVDGARCEGAAEQHGRVADLAVEADARPVGGAAPAAVSNSAWRRSRAAVSHAWLKEPRAEQLGIDACAPRRSRTPEAEGHDLETVYGTSDGFEQRAQAGGGGSADGAAGSGAGMRCSYGVSPDDVLGGMCGAVAHVEAIGCATIQVCPWSSSQPRDPGGGAADLVYGFLARLRKKAVHHSVIPEGQVNFIERLAVPSADVGPRIRPAFFSGCIWALGFLFMIKGITQLGFAVGYTLDAVGPIGVASVISICFFKEITESGGRGHAAKAKAEAPKHGGAGAPAPPARAAEAPPPKPSKTEAKGGHQGQGAKADASVPGPGHERAGAKALAAAAPPPTKPTREGAERQKPAEASEAEPAGCLRFPGVRLADGKGGAFAEVSGGKGKGALDADACEAACRSTTKCEQAIFSASANTCYMFQEVSRKLGDGVFEAEEKGSSDYHESMYCGANATAAQEVQQSINSALQEGKRSAGFLLKHGLERWENDSAEKQEAIRAVQQNWDEAERRASETLANLGVYDKVPLIHGEETISGYAGWLSTGNAGGGPLAMNDGPQGYNAYRKNLAGTATQLPALLCLAATFDPEQARRYAKTVAAEFAIKGSNVLLGPDVEVIRAPLSGRSFETLSGEDPFLGSALVGPFVREVQDRGIIATVKHWLDNNQEVFRQSMNVEVDDRAQHEIYMPVFKAAFEAGAGAVMCAYNKVRGDHACESNYLLTQLLREEVGFRGYVVSDWGAVHDGIKAANAGLDVEMPNGKYFSGLDVEGQADRVHQMAQHVLASMYASGQMDGKFTGAGEKGKVWAVSTNGWHKEVAKEINVAGTVILKNKDGLLPLDVTGKTIAMVGKYCDQAIEPAYGQGSVFAGGGSGYVETTGTVTPFEGLMEIAGNASTGAAKIWVAAKPEDAKGADVAVVCVAAHAEEGWDRADAEMPEAWNLLAPLRKKFPAMPVVVLAVTPGPVTTDSGLGRPRRRRRDDVHARRAGRPRLRGHPHWQAGAHRAPPRQPTREEGPRAASPRSSTRASAKVPTSRSGASG
ncbi:unnamed protein product [Prorocentrum cordatum]|uniref:Probable beta-glucosidase G n=1 Tax=Prorocentrum cordatum TaxID=2364126 RepID=A0ABN9V129_9DINO|nr:unnamed protein product [Polarella glacialis]